MRSARSSSISARTRASTSLRISLRRWRSSTAEPPLRQVHLGARLLRQLGANLLASLGPGLLDRQSHPLVGLGLEGGDLLLKLLGVLRQADVGLGSHAGLGIRADALRARAALIGPPDARLGLSEGRGRLVALGLERGQALGHLGAHLALELAADVLALLTDRARGILARVGEGRGIARLGLGLLEFPLDLGE